MKDSIKKVDRAALQRMGWPAIMSVLVMLGYGYMDYDNLAWRSIYIPGLLCLPLVFSLGSPAISWRYLWPTLGVLLLLCVLRSSTLYYLCCCCAVLLLWESSVGKRGPLPLFLFLALSNIAQHLSYVWSFPIRIQLSSLAAKALASVGFAVGAQGNIVVFEGQEFSVDPACMGLLLLTTTLVIGIFIMASAERQSQRRLPFAHVCLGFLLLLLLAVLANFVRLLALILFRILPESPLHDVVGLVSLTVYALLPFYFLWRWWSRRGPALPLAEHAKLPPFPPARYALHLALVLAVLAAGLPYRQAPEAAPVDIASDSLSGYEQSWTENGVLKLTNGDALIYIKPPVRAFQGAHDPRICWQGSGYEFTRISTLQLGEHTLYQAVLEQKGRQLFTAWWYDAGPHKTIDERAWRWATLRGQGAYKLINITAAHPECLLEEVGAWLE